MANKEFPCCGYVLPVSHLRSLFPLGVQTLQFDSLLADGDWEGETFLCR